MVSAVLECANCSRHATATVEGAQSETVVTVSLSTVPRLSLLSRQSRRLSGDWGSRRAGEGGRCR